MQRELVSQVEQFPFAGRDEFIRGERNYDKIIRPLEGEVIAVHKGEGDLVGLDPVDIKSPKTYLSHLAWMVRCAQARHRIEKIRFQARARECGPDKAFDQMNTANLKTITYLRANAAGFGYTAWKNKDVTTAVQAFDVAGILGDEVVKSALIELLTDRHFRDSYRENLISSLRVIQKERLRTGEDMEDIRTLVILAREFSN